MLRCNGSLGRVALWGYALCSTQIRKLSATWPIWSLCDRATHCLTPLRRYYAALQHTWPTIFRLEVGHVLPTTKATMKVGQRVRFKSTSAARYWKIPQDAQGTVMCSYRLLTSNRARADRLDVRITPELVIWGGAAEDFEEIRDIPERTMQ